MASQVDICNLALLQCGANPITSISDPNKPGRTMATLWDTVRQAELRKRNWNFALSRASLPALSTVPISQFDQQFQLPADFLRLVSVGDFYADPALALYRNSDDSPYAIEGDILLTIFPAPLNIRYVADITNPGIFDPLFVMVLASALALQAVEPITQSSTKKADIAQMYKDAVKEAMKANAIERPPQGIPDSSWILSRL